MTTLCRLFRVNAQRLVLPVVAAGAQLTPSALDPERVRLNAILLNKQRPDAPEGAGASLSGDASSP